MSTPFEDQPWPVELRYRSAEKTLEARFRRPPLLQPAGRVAARREPVGRSEGARRGQDHRPRPPPCRHHPDRAGRQLRRSHPLRRPAHHRHLHLIVPAPPGREPRGGLAHLPRRAGRARPQPRSLGPATERPPRLRNTPSRHRRTCWGAGQPRHPADVDAHAGRDHPSIRLSGKGEGRPQLRSWDTWR